MSGDVADVGAVFGMTEFAKQCRSALPQPSDSDQRRVLSCHDDMLNRRIASSTLSKPPLLSKRRASNYPAHSSITPFRALQSSAQLLPKHSCRQEKARLRRNGSSFALHSQPPTHSSPDIDPDSPPELSDNEWEIRTGRAIFVLQLTIPEFFDIGLITSMNKESGSPRLSTSSPIANINILEQYTLQDDDEPIYSPHLRLSYTPPIELPQPFPQTFHIDGIQLYVASASIIRHTMNALYSDLTIELTKMAVSSPQPPTSSSSSKAGKLRQKSVVLRLCITGVARVTRKPAEWVVELTYGFSPVTGLIHEHIINSIHPAPHQAVYDSLHSAFGSLLGWGSSPRPNLPNSAAFKDQVASGKST